MHYAFVFCFFFLTSSIGEFAKLFMHVAFLTRRGMTSSSSHIYIHYSEWKLKALKGNQ